MKQVSNTRMFVEFILIMFAAYLILSGVIAIIGGLPYRDVLCSPGQILGVMFCYWWIPIARMCDLEERNTASHRRRVQ
jgi:hypothetical protein